ncbi:hypothetical protein SANTM175S_02821 [Streptomyces antimycoticus]
MAHAKEAGRGVTFDGPLKLGAKGALLAWSVAAMVIHLALTGLFGPRDPEPALPPVASPEERVESVSACLKAARGVRRFVTPAGGCSPPRPCPWTPFRRVLKRRTG